MPRYWKSSRSRYTTYNVVCLGTRSLRNSIQPEQVDAVSEAARLLGLSPSSLRTLEQQGRLQCTRTPGRLPEGTLEMDPEKEDG